jgi:hypothetical protein
MTILWAFHENRPKQVSAYVDVNLAAIRRANLCGIAVLAITLALNLFWSLTSLLPNQLLILSA